MTSPKRSMRDILARTPVMPIITLHSADTAGALARALVDGGILAFEVVLRTSATLDAVRAMVEAAPEADVGVGTLLTPRDVQSAVDAGATFGVSPGLTPALAESVRLAGLPFLPGVASASEIMSAIEAGFNELKYFPAQGLAGAAWLSAMAGVFPRAIFCPTGGIKPEHIPEYLTLPNCGTVGGSWVTPAKLIEARDWVAITALARRAAGMKGA
ncbi:MAG: bifunctional 4-hydroxy-2-oxoglutarate aldolase/2-dehydro-3-deoxy-phosphogluconate aldolase [Castellaniella sp.]|uniref:bifunctional 4-hydroxy-2-oxoglutarate aldolase/2-dehydro-3-deoxy-phosphogluconate aldolase n=1 Tax=Castellaniella sp. TaxID=1955812 RepID=UPI003C7702B3